MPLLHRGQRRPGRVGEQELVQGGHRRLLRSAHGRHEDEVRVLLQDHLEREVLQERVLAVRDVDAAQVLEHLAGHVVAALGAHARGVRAQEQDRRGLVALLAGDGRLDARLDVRAVLLVEVLAAGDAGEDLEHAQVVVKGLHVKVGAGHARALQRAADVRVLGDVGGEDGKVHPGAENRLQVRGLERADVDRVLGKADHALVKGLLRGGADLAAGQDPHVRKAGLRREDARGRGGQGDGAAVVVGKGDGGLARVRLGGGGGARAQKKEQREQEGGHGGPAKVHVRVLPFLCGFCSGSGRAPRFPPYSTAGRARRQGARKAKKRRL